MENGYSTFTTFQGMRYHGNVKSINEPEISPVCLPLDESPIITLSVCYKFFATFPWGVSWCGALLFKYLAVMLEPAGQIS